jgi:hypothetical protein
MAYINEVNLERNLLDADGFLPVSQKLIVGNYIQDKDDLPLLIDRAVGGGGAESWADGVTTMTVAGAADYAIAQTKFCHPYVSSHPSIYTMTFARFEVQPNVIKRVGAFRSNKVAPYNADFDGIYLESDGVDIKAVIDKGGVNLISIPRANWDDPLDGTGPSGINYDFSQFSVLQLDFLYLGGTWVRFALIIGGELVYFYTHKHSGSFPSTFVNSPYFHIRWEIRSTGGAGQLDQICGAFAVLGSRDTVGREFSIDNDTDFINANSTGTEYMLLAIRLKSTNLNSYVIPKTATSLATTNDNYILRLRINPTIAGPLSWTSLNNNSCEYAKGSIAGLNTITATNPPLASIYSAQQQTGVLQEAFLSAIGSNIDGTADILTISAVPLSSNMDIFASLNLTEI